MLILRLISFAIGLTLITYVLFSYEDEEKKAQNWLESAWAALADRDCSVSSRINRFLQRLLIGLSNFLSRIYGVNLLSLRAFVAAYLFCFALAAGFFGVSTVIFSQGAPSIVAATVALILLALLNHRPVLILSTALIVFLVASQYMFSISARYEYWKPAFFLLGPSMLLPSAVELASIAGIRWLLAFAQRTSRLRVTLIVSATAVIIPLFAAALGVIVGATIFGDPDGTLSFEQEEVVLPYIAWAIFNASLILLVVIAAATVRIAYAVLPRAIYGLLKLKITTNRKSIFSFGGILVGVAFPSVGEFIKKAAGYIFPH